MNAPRLRVLGEKTRRLLTGALGQSWDVTVVRDGCAALALLAAEVFDVAVLGAEGNTQQTAADFVQAVKRIAPETELVILSHGRPGAWPYILNEGSILEEGIPSYIAESRQAREIYLGERFSL